MKQIRYSKYNYARGSRGDLNHPSPAVPLWPFWALRPCLLSPKIQKLFNILCHIESLYTCIEY